MADPSKKMSVSDGEVLCELLQEYDYGNISERKCSRDNEINMNISSCFEQSVSSDEEENASVTAIAGSIAYGQSQVVNNHVFHLLASLA
jgi:hypothetical protein